MIDPVNNHVIGAAGRSPPSPYVTTSRPVNAPQRTHLRQTIVQKRECGRVAPPHLPHRSVRTAPSLPSPPSLGHLREFARAPGLDDARLRGLPMPTRPFPPTRRAQADEQPGSVRNFTTHRRSVIIVAIAVSSGDQAGERPLSLREGHVPRRHQSRKAGVAHPARRGGGCGEDAAQARAAEGSTSQARQTRAIHQLITGVLPSGTYRLARSWHRLMISGDGAAWYRRVR
jgi:hypothetical protein